MFPLHNDVAGKPLLVEGVTKIYETCKKPLEASWNFLSTSYNGRLFVTVMKLDHLMLSG